MQRVLIYRWWLFAVIAAFAGAAMWLMVWSAWFIDRNAQYVLYDDAAKQMHSTSVGLVLGSLVTEDGKPYKQLKARLNTAADALESGYVDKLLVSGDNRFPGYDEPTAMKKYLVEERHVDAAKIQTDFAGRSTYESCERAAKVFELQRTIIFSTDSHLPRAIFLCRHFGVEAYGIASANQTPGANSREIMAGVKAILNVYAKGEETILGTPIPME